MSVETLETVEPLNIQHRRCAAYQTLAEVLDGELLMRAMWLLEERDHHADKTTFISFVGVTAELLGVNNHVINSLYSRLNHYLNQPMQQLQNDPLQEMLAYRDNTSKGSATNTVLSTPSTPAKNREKTKGTPEMTVFVSLISKIVLTANYPTQDSYAVFKQVFSDEITTITLDDDSLKQMLAWVNELNLKVFKKNFIAEHLAEIVHCIYIALCEALGPVEADKLLKTAITHTEKLPLAKTFSPKNFL